MSPQNAMIDLEQFDADGAVAETGGRLDPHTRGAFLRGPGIGAAGGGRGRRGAGRPARRGLGEEVRQARSSPSSTTR